jgi:hypothetical protein
MLFMAEQQVALSTAPAATVGPRGLRWIVGIMAFAAVITVAYWVIWFGIDRTILASSQAPAYFTFENAFPVADAWLTITLILGALGLARLRPWGLLSTLLAGGAGVYLGCMDVLFDLENGIYHIAAGADPSPVLIEITINVLTFALSVGILTYIWRNRAWFLGGAA